MRIIFWARRHGLRTATVCIIFLYYLSERDGFCCVWVQKLDLKTKKPDGDIQAVYHAHQARFRLNFPPGSGTLAVAKNKLALWVGETTGNIYVATPKKK